MDLLGRASALVNQMWLVISNHCEAGAYSSKVDYYGRSQIISPTGHVVARLDQQEGLACHTADLRAEVMFARTEAFFGLSLMADRRPGPVRGPDPQLRGAVTHCQPGVATSDAIRMATSSQVMPAPGRTTKASWRAPAERISRSRRTHSSPCRTPRTPR